MTMSPRTGPSPDSNSVRRTTRYKDEPAPRHRDLAVTEQKRRVSLRDVERLIGVRVQVKGRRGLAWREHADNRDVGTGRSAGPKWVGSIESWEAMTVHPLTVSIFIQPTPSGRVGTERTSGRLCEGAGMSLRSPAAHAVRFKRQLGRATLWSLVT